MATIELGADWEIENSNESDLRIRHGPSGNVLVFDQNGVLDVGETDTEVLNGADIEAASADFLLVTDGNGNFQLQDKSVVSSGLTDTDIRDAINSDTDHGSTAPHNYFSENPSDLNQEGALTGQAIVWNGSQWEPGDVASGSGGAAGYEETDQISLAAGNHKDIPLFHENGEKLQLLSWGISLTSGATDSDVQIEFNPPPSGDSPSTTMVLNESPKTDSSSPIDSHTAGGAEKTIAQVRINHTNSNGTDYVSGAGNGAIQYYVRYNRA